MIHNGCFPFSDTSRHKQYPKILTLHLVFQQIFSGTLQQTALILSLYSTNRHI